MATSDMIQQLADVLERLSSVDMQALDRTSLGEESLAIDLEPRKAAVQQIVDLATRYASLVHNQYVSQIHSTIEAISNLMTQQAQLDSSQYIAQRQEFLQGLDTNIEEAKNWKPILASAAMLERGFLDDEGIKHESERALENLQKQAEKTLAEIKDESQRTIERS